MDGILIAILALFVVCAGGMFLYQFLRRKGVVNAGWSLDPWSHGVKLENMKGNTFSFEFPAGDGVHMVDKRGKTEGHQFIAMHFEITGQSPVFISMEGDKPKVRLHMAGARLWSHRGADLVLGRQIFSVPLEPEHWQTVDGYPCNFDQAHINQFNEAVAKEKSVGFTFGGENHGYAHGVGLKSGNATFRLVDFEP